MKGIYSSKQLFLRLFHDYIAKHAAVLCLAILCMMLVAASTAGNAWLMQPMLDKVFVEKDSQMIMLVPIAVLALAVIKGFATYGQSVIMRNIGQRLVCDMQVDLYGHLLEADLALFHDQASGKLISRFTNDIQLLRTSVSAIFTVIAKEFLTLVFLVGVMIHQSIALSIITFCVYPIAILPMLKLARRMRKLSGKTQAELGSFTARLDETFQGIRIIKAFGKEEQEKERAKGIIEGLYKLYAKASKVQAASSPLMETLSGFAIAGVVWYGGSEVLAGNTTPGSFFSFVTAMVMAYRPAKTLANLSTNMQEGMAAAERLYTVLDKPPHIKDSVDAKELIITKAEVEFKNVSFSYDGTREILKGISFTATHDAKIAFVGPSGGGKSTLFNLILRFYENQGGNILIDGQDIKNCTLKSLRNAISLVTQETILFDDTIRANICYGLESVSDDKMIEAAKMAGAHNFISVLPDGYDTLIGQHGVRISGGQRQRLAIARALLKNSPILLLDEATSALDPSTERQVQEAIEKLMVGRTSLIIAHRLSTIMNADVIYVVKDGQIAEFGRHEDLLRKSGIYSSLYKQESSEAA